ncbi:MAG TPA: hypothetical protein VK806_07630 [Bacteroidia bacterium]|jgi:hypothetical protein|nr:hypothetical protein [Bacteroidia bacterium]
MRKAFFITTIVLLCSSASFAKHSLKDSTRHDSVIQKDGSSYNNAVIIKATNEGDGIDAEYKWLADHYPGYKTEGQSLNEHDKIPYDVLHIKTNDGQRKDVFFDISSYFGKW